MQWLHQKKNTEIYACVLVWLGKKKLREKFLKGAFCGGLGQVVWQQKEVFEKWEKKASCSHIREFK